jgi:superfamily II DNA or RNA helicase
MVRHSSRSVAKKLPVAPGSRILVRDAEWLVRRVDRTSAGGQAVSVVGIDELVRDKEAIFLDDLDEILVLDPAETKIVFDDSSSYRKSLLYMESLLRQTAPTDDNLHLGDRAAMDALRFQLDPAIQALEQPRQRILISDAVGLGKTLECGILLSELIRRGKGKRILVLAVKSMLTQFQKEMWSRFTIPLTRLDSVGIQRVRRNIPTNHNPFYYYDRSIISIDTLKQDSEYRTYLENAYWDIIVVDEAHNVAERGKELSLRAKLAKLLSHRSDTLILLSATPHDGKARSFASLMNMLDPTAIANPDKYSEADIKGLYIRRFKKDIQDQVGTSFPKRKISVARSTATAAEERAYQGLVDLTFTRIDSRPVSGQQLFKTTLEKALLSSPQACMKTVENRIGKLQRTTDKEGKRVGETLFEVDIASLQSLAQDLERIELADFSKYEKLLQVIRDKEKGFGWTGKDPADRLVIFTERIATKTFLAENLKRDLKLKDGEIVTLDGTDSDQDQMRVVEDFGKDNAKVRLLIASDVASEGINLHYLCHRMIHFDIPWSLMVFHQRNGRIDRYGQDKTPHIVYLVTDSDSEKIKGDTRILELLIKKDEQVVSNIGDPSTWMGVYDIDTEELLTAQAMEQRLSPEQFEADISAKAKDKGQELLDLFSGPPPVGERAQAKTRRFRTLYSNDYDFLKAAIEQINATSYVQHKAYDDEQRIELTAPDDLKHRFRFLPREVWPEDGGFQLSARVATIEREIRRCRKEEKAWPDIHYLWPLNPVLEWANDKVLAAFGRHEAPLVCLPDKLLPQGELVFILSGLIPNRKGHPLLHSWFAVQVDAKGKILGVEEFRAMLERMGLGEGALVNRGNNGEDCGAIEALLPQVIDRAKAWMSQQRTVFQEHNQVKLDQHLDALGDLEVKQYLHLDTIHASKRGERTSAQEKHQENKREVKRVFEEFCTWVKETMSTEDNPYIKVVAVLRGQS